MNARQVWDGERLARYERDWTDDGTTPEAHILLAVVLQSLEDAPRTDHHGASARSLLGDPGVQDIVRWLWDVDLTAEFDRGHARQEIRLYRRALGNHLQRKHQGAERAGTHSERWFEVTQ